MHFKDFLQWIRSTGERYVVLDHDGEPEFVIEPFDAKKKRSSVDMIQDTIAEVAENERAEIHGWDDMVETLQHAAGNEPGTPETPEKKNEEPLFQFEEIDE